MKPASLEKLELRLHEPMPVPERVRLLNEISEQLYEREPRRGATLAREAIERARRSSLRVRATTRRARRRACTAWGATSIRRPTIRRCSRRRTRR
jgi:hypothetical protein